MSSKDIIWLACSIKLSGNCIAGLHIGGEGWIRPVCSSPDGTLFTYHYELICKGDALKNPYPIVLDLIRVPLIRPNPKMYQKENWLINSQEKWELLERPASKEKLKLLKNYLESGSKIFGDLKDRISCDCVSNVSYGTSLSLVAPENLYLESTENQKGNPQARAIFYKGNQLYNLAITDPEWKLIITRQRKGKYPIAFFGISSEHNIFLTVSLGEPFNGYCYKLVAAIFFM